MYSSKAIWRNTTLKLLEIHGSVRLFFIIYLCLIFVIIKTSELNNYDILRLFVLTCGLQITKSKPCFVSTQMLYHNKSGDTKVLERSRRSKNAILCNCQKIPKTTNSGPQSITQLIKDWATRIY